MHKFTEFDSAHGILGGSRTPEAAGSEIIAEWKSLRNGINNIPSPGEIEKKKLSFSVLKAFSAMHHIGDALQGMKNAGIHPGPSAIAQKDVLS